MIRSIRGRVVILVLLAQIVAITGAAGLAIWYVRRALWSTYGSELQARMISVLALVGEAEENPNGLTFDGNQADIPSGDLYYIQDMHGHPVAGSPSWIYRGHRNPQNPTPEWTFYRAAKHYRAKVLRNAPILDQEDLKIPQLRVDVFYAVPVNNVETQVENATRIAISVGLLSLILSFGSTWWAVARGMRPLTEFARQADLIEADGVRFDEPANTVHSLELVPLARALHALVNRLQAAFSRERQFLSDAAHELKTTVAIQKSTLQLLEQGKTNEKDYREGIARALEDTSRTENLVADMLLLASIEHLRPSLNSFPAGEDGVVSSLNESLQAAIDRLQPMARLKSVSIVFRALECLQIRGKEYEFKKLWMNLIENAIQHSPQGSQVVVELRNTEGPNICVRVVDSGAGISPQDISHVFERFYRSDSSRSRLTGGFGLGLSIAKAIVLKNQGSIKIQSAPQAGTVVEVRLPRAPA